MNEVACVFRPLVEEVRARRIPPEKLLHGLPVALEELGNPRRRISWDDFAELAQRCSEVLGPDAFEEIAARSAEAAVPRPLRWLLARVGTVRGAYRISPFWGPRVFRATRAECELLPDGRVREVIEILPGYRESPEFFYGVRGLLRATPRLFGQPEARVELESDGRRGEFLIEPAPPPGPRRPRGAPVSQSDPVERLARALSRARGWHELPGVAARLLQRELGVRGATLTRARSSSHAPEALAETGDRSGRPASARPLVFAGRKVGWLSLWTPGEAPLGEEAERRLHALRPLLAFLVESLQLADANQRLTQLLENNLSDWKRVEAVLEKIAGETGADGDPLLASAIPPFAGTVLLIEDDELRRWRGRREIEAQGHPVVATASDLSDLPLGDPASGPIRLVVADLESSALQPESIRRIARLHPELRGVLLVALRRT